MADESGRGDPERTLELLWGTREPASRGPKPGLTIEQIVAAAIGLADADGLDALSMRRLAGELGVGTMSLYRYVPGKAELVDLMLDALNREIATPDGGEAGWRELLEHYAREGWAMLRRHPWAATAQTRPVLGPNTLDSYEAVLSAAARTGLEPGDVLNAAELVSGYVDGAARRLAEAAETQRRTGVSDEQWWAERESMWERYFDVERYPMLTAMWEAGAFDARADAFEFGLQRVLDGIEAHLARRHTL
jgi:AcrR family transcriptional regulator